MRAGFGCPTRLRATALTSLTTSKLSFFFLAMASSMEYFEGEREVLRWKNAIFLLRRRNSGNTL